MKKNWKQNKWREEGIGSKTPDCQGSRFLNVEKIKRTKKKRRIKIEEQRSEFVKKMIRHSPTDAVPFSWLRDWALYFILLSSHHSESDSIIYYYYCCWLICFSCRVIGRVSCTEVGLVLFLGGSGIFKQKEFWIPTQEDREFNEVKNIFFLLRWKYGALVKPSVSRNYILTFYWLFNKKVSLKN